jgi:regulator of sigma E protease
VDDEPTAYWSDVNLALDDAAGEGRAAVLRLESAGGFRRSVVVSPAAAESLNATLLPFIPSTIGQVTVGAPAYQAGLRDGDRIVEIEGLPIDSWWDLRDAIMKRPGMPTEIVVEREGERLARSVTPAEQGGRGVIGIIHEFYGTGVRRYGPGESISRGVGYTLQVCANFANGLRQLFSAPQSLGSNLAGPIAIVQMSADQAQRGRTDLLNWLIFISIALMTMNLLPIPVLDGGHILVAVIEGVSRRPLGPRFMLAFWRAGMVFLLLLMTFAIANDGLKLVQRSRANRQAPPVEEAPADASAPAEAGN